MFTFMFLTITSFPATHGNSGLCSFSKLTVAKYYEWHLAASTWWVNNVDSFSGHWNEKYLMPILKTEILIYESKANLLVI